MANASIADLTIRGDRGTFKLRDIITDADEYHFNISADVGWGSVHGVAELIMEHLAPKFGVRQTGTEEAGGRSDAVLCVFFAPEIPEDRFEEYSAFLGQSH
jgi:hypothetical protein